MSSYEGRATVFDADGDEFAEVEAALTAPEGDVQLDEPWFGTIWGDFDAFDLMEGTPRIRLADGREGTFTLTRTDLVVPRNGIPITGVGKPFF